MARPKKVTEPEELTEAEVYDVLRYAQELNGYGFYGNATSPFLLNSRMRDVSLNPIQATETSLTEALKSPKESELVLQAFSQDFEIQSQVYKKLIDYMGNMLSFDLMYSCTNIEKPEEYKSKAYLKDRDIVAKFLDAFDYKKEFSVVVKQLLRNEAYFCLPRFDGNKYVLQELPSSPQYTMITGRWEYGLAFSLNMLWFILPGVDLRLYPKFFMEKYKTIWGDGKLQKYNPALPIEARGDSSYIYWQDIPASVGWCFKKSPEIATRVPYFTGLFLDLIQQPLIRALQKNISMSAANRLIIGQVGTLKDAAAKVKDQFTINPDTLGKFLSLVKAAVGESLKVAAAPLDQIQKIQFDESNEVYSSYLKTALATSGVNTNLIFTSDVRPNTVESQLSLSVDEMAMTNLYPQFNSFLEYYINQRTSKYKFKFNFEGTEFYTDRERRFTRASDLADKGMVLPQMFSSAIGMNPFTFQRQLDEARINGFVDNLTPIVSAFQMSGDSKSGRPRKSDSELSDSGSETRGAGSNIAKGKGKI